MSRDQLDVPACAARSSAVFTPPFSPAKKTFTGAAVFHRCGRAAREEEDEEEQEGELLHKSTCWGGEIASPLPITRPYR